VVTASCLNESFGGPCLQADGSLGPCDVHLGCSDGVPFAVAELRRVLDKATLLAGPAIPLAAAQVRQVEASYPDWMLLPDQSQG